MAWLSRRSPRTPYLTGIARPMALISAGQDGALGPLIPAGIAGVATEDAGAASGFAAADSSALHGARFSLTASPPR
jgi:hypothetical protein